MIHRATFDVETGALSGAFRHTPHANEPLNRGSWGIEIAQMAYYRRLCTLRRAAPRSLHAFSHHKDSPYHEHLHQTSKRFPRLPPQRDAPTSAHLPHHPGGLHRTWLRGDRHPMFRAPRHLDGQIWRGRRPAPVQGLAARPKARARAAKRVPHRHGPGRHGVALRSDGATGAHLRAVQTICRVTSSATRSRQCGAPTAHRKAAFASSTSAMWTSSARRR